MTNGRRRSAGQERSSVCRWGVVLTDALGGRGAGLEAVVAVAPVAADRVDAAPVLTDARFCAALVLVCQENKLGLDFWKGSQSLALLQCSGLTANLLTSKHGFQHSILSHQGISHPV